jgi:hypothetical protein
MLKYKPMEPTIFGAQLAIFHSLEYLTGGTIKVPELMSPRFEGLVITPIPIPSDAPAEIPRYEMRSGNLVFKFTNIRADMISETGDFTDAQISNFIEAVIGFRVTINRVGYAINKRYSAIQADFLESNLNLNSERFGAELANVTEASWRINKKKVLGAADNCNNISTLSLEIEGGIKNAILVRDVNTEQENELGLSNVAEVRTIVSLLGSEALRNDNISL